MTYESIQSYFILKNLKLNQIRKLPVLHILITLLKAFTLWQYCNIVVKVEYLYFILEDYIKYFTIYINFFRKKI